MKLSTYIPENARLIKDKEYSTMGFVKPAYESSIFIFIREKKYLKDIIDKTNITCVLCTEEILNDFPQNNYGIMVSQHPDISFFQIHNKNSNNKKYIRENFETKIQPSSFVSSLAKVAKNNVSIGKGCIIEDFVNINEGVAIGDNVTVRSGVVIGSEGFQFVKANNYTLPVTHLGGVIIHNNVEIQSNSVIDKALFPWDNTIIGEHTKIDSLVHVAHACKIGERCIITSSVSLGGNCVVNDNVWMAPGAKLLNRIIVGKSSFIGIGSVVIRNVPENKTVFGVPARVLENTN
jgi:UDP-3-O-[3-hydroxymyristoyl] glucosamine N-acyltransferase